MENKADSTVQTSQDKIEQLAEILSCSSFTSQEAQSNIDLKELDVNTQTQAKLVIPGFNLLLEKK
tara:strand:+ start:72 stop:266 length:195 start_codon:yes stop_codon:yes gene_type:complete